MLSKIPFSMEKLEQGDITREILRIGLIAELDAINLYEQLASLTNDEKIKAVFLDIAREEKTHVGEFLTLLLMNDEEQEDELEEGKEEVEELFEEEEE
ncbi:MAG: ferritin family protein [Thermodesulfovibrio sp.]|uniref:Rubrerythrin n=2 Tax=Thermodesulfovibrio TaxID=28261 RepID=A0A2J6WIH0_9BACT|nr:MAG: rubrerythrin [Thermodesulfovibrio aggregans]